VLPVRPRGRSAGARQPVQRDVVEDVVACEVAHRLAVDEGAGDLVVAVGVVVEQPGGLGKERRRFRSEQCCSWEPPFVGGQLHVTSFLVEGPACAADITPGDWSSKSLLKSSYTSSPTKHNEAPSEPT